MLKIINSVEELKIDYIRVTDPIETVMLWSEKSINFELFLPLRNPIMPLDNPPDVYAHKFDTCEFKQEFTIHTSEVGFWFINCDFYENISLNNSKMKGKVRFHNCRFHKNTSFSNTTFEDLADFWNSTFYKKVIFYKTDFMDTVVFSATTFKQNVLFTYTLIKQLIILRGTKIDKGIDLSLAIIAGNLSVFDFKLDNYPVIDINPFVKENIRNRTFENTKEKERVFKEIYEHKYEESVSIDAEIPIPNKRETFRIIKRYHESQSNIIESLPFKILEKETLRIELLQFKNSFINLVNRFILWLNKKSNNYGVEFGRGLFFTAIVGLLFFILSIITTENYYFTINPFEWSSDTFLKSVKYYFISLNPTHKYTYLDDEAPKTAFYVWDFLGRIFVGYGIYQTIQAFRKFR